MANKTSGVEEILGRWREEIKNKQRRIISFEETVEIKIKALKQWIFPDTEPLNGWEKRGFRFTRHRERLFTDDTWQPIEVGETWGGPDMSALFRCTAKMPERFKGKKVALKVYFGGDGLLSLDGKPFHGLDPFRDTVLLTDCATGAEEYQFDTESYIFWHFGESEVKTFESSYFAVMDQEMSDTYWDFRAAYNVMVMPNIEQDAAEFLKAGMAEAIQYINQNEPDATIFCTNARKARAVLHELIYSSEKFKHDGLVHMCGNSHLDVVFLWTHAEFTRKLGRTHATTLRLMEQYPDYIFSQSQPLMYQEMKTLYPTMYEEVKQRVKEGRWEVIGGFWVEPDCNLISGESFVRQILNGTRFIQREFGVTPRTCWCPDVFGNAWTMPQILLRSGMPYFVTHKMVVWNDTNPWKKNTFWWQGPDGSRVLSLVPPTHFIGTVEPDHIMTHWGNFSDKATINESLYNFGWGDGGGGPDVEMLEYQKRYTDFPGLVPSKSNTIEGALDSIAARAADADLPIVNDELYLEEHRGVHTTKARLKKLNRRCEYLYRNAELWSCFASTPYPRTELSAGWIELLNNQFHDSLPGSHIPPVYLDLLEAYDRTVATGNGVLQAALGDIANRIDTRDAGQPLVIFNAQPQERCSLAQWETPERQVHVLDPAGAEVPCQFITHYETGKRLLVFPAQVPGVGYAVYQLVEGPGHVVAPVAVTPTTLENAHLRVTINGEGEIISLLDKATGRDYFTPTAKGNVLKLYEDVPGKYEAWDIAPSYTDVEFNISGATVTVVENGPVRSAIEVSRQFLNTRMVQRIVLTQDAARVDFQTWVDWHEQQKLLKTRFYTDITTRTATYDIAYGNIERSCYRNNSFDAAKFEVAAHQWMDLSQPDAGLSLLNDCKYGHEAYDRMMALTLLRGPMNPDPTSDQEEHWFTYSLFPHAGVWRAGGTMQQALDLNDPLAVISTAQHTGSLPKVNALLQIDTDHVTLEAVKLAEDSADVVIRVVERHGATAPVTITLPTEIITAVECNLMEQEPTPVASAERCLSFTIKPYEIRTFMVTLATAE